MIVYVVIHSVYCEGDDIEAVFSTREAAEAYCEKSRIQKGYPEYDPKSDFDFMGVHEWEVDKFDPYYTGEAVE